MADVWANLGNGIYRKVKKAFYRPFSVFDIGWTKEKFLKHQTSNSLQSHLYKNKYKVTFENGPSFLISIKELFINELYKFRSDKDNPVIIDCGSYIGTSILYFKDNYPNAVVLGFEPDQKNYQILKTNLENWNFSNVQVQNAAIWINNGNIFFNSRGDMSS